MPSNKELIASANKLGEELAEKLGAPVEIETDGKNNEQLSALVSDLRAKVADASNQTDADKAEAEAKAKAKAKAAKKPPFYVAPGKSLTSKRGILTGDRSDEVKADDLAGGREALEAFVESGHVLKGG